MGEWVWAAWVASVVVVAVVAAWVARWGAVPAALYRGVEARLEAAERGRVQAELQAALGEQRAEPVPVLEAALREKDAALGAVREELAALKSGGEAQAAAWAEKVALLEAAEVRMVEQFRAVSGELMSHHGEAFKGQNKEQVEGLLAPLREKLAEFQTGLGDAHKESLLAKERLGQQIRSLMEHGVVMQQEAQNLTRALKGDVRRQGAWGELVLDAVLESSGLVAGTHYEVQGSVSGEDGRRLRPDVVLSLPGKGRVVIDSKVSLAAFEALVNAERDEDRAAHLGRHKASLKAHVDGLSHKDYAAHVESRLGWVVMFVPIEGALAAALASNADLVTYASRKNVLFATPTTLLALLRAVEAFWQGEQRNRNAEAIADRGAALYDKFVGFYEDLVAVKDALAKATKALDGAEQKLSRGPGNLVRQVETLKGLGVRTKKALPPALVEMAGAEALAMEPGE